MGADPSYLVISDALVMLMTPIGMAIAVFKEEVFHLFNLI